ncbi:MAG: type VII secretion protein EccB [Actinomycetia bacterium]|nr:type VII secretion protein EccB [Actinomycetes bacterium]
MAEHDESPQQPRRRGTGLTYASLEQWSSWRFLWHRMSVAVARHSARLVHDPSKNYGASAVVGTVVAVLIIGVCFVVSWIRPMGQIAEGTKLVADRSSGALFVNVGGTMHPALNLASARLVIGRPESPKLVPMAEIEKYPMGPIVGIEGAPNDLVPHAPAATGWGLCDRVSSGGSKVTPRVTVLTGVADLGDWAHEMQSPEAVLMTYGGTVYLVTDGHRSQIDLADRPVMLALGLQAGSVKTVPMSRALYEALIPTAPLRVPDVPNPGGPVGYWDPDLAVVSGSVLKALGATGEQQFFVALPAGLQMIPKSVALMLHNADLAGTGRVLEVEPNAVAQAPHAVGFDTSMYPRGPLKLLDKAASPVTCVMWRKDSAQPQATVTTVSGRRLPIAIGEEARVINLVSAKAHDAADAVYLGPESANFVQVTGVEPNSGRSESLWWIGATGVRFGIETAGQGNRTLASLGLDAARPTLAPWAVIRWLPAGPTLSPEAAKVEHDTLAGSRTAVPMRQGR